MSVPITVIVAYDSGISFQMKNSEEVFINLLRYYSKYLFFQKTFQTTMFKDISQIITDLDENGTNGILKLKISDAKEVPK